MWAQLIKVRLKPGKDLAVAAAQLRAAEQPGSGLVREMFIWDPKDPGQATSWPCSKARRKRVRASGTRAARKGCKPCRRRWQTYSPVLRSSPT
jgi:hypothetical protein